MRVAGAEMVHGKPMSECNILGAIGNGNCEGMAAER